MILELSKAEIALIQRAASYLLMSGRMAKAEKPVAHELLRKLGVGFLPAIQRVVDHAPAMEEHRIEQGRREDAKPEPSRLSVFPVQTP